MHAMRVAPAFEGTSRFTIQGSLGAGGMGVVYLAWDREREMRVALKTLGNADPGHLARLKNEFRALADLSHPNLVGLYELFAEHGRWFFTMEAIEGVRFDAWTATSPRLGQSDLLLTTRVESGPRLKRAARDASSEMSGDVGDAPDEVMHEPASALSRPVADLAKLRRALAGLVDGVEALHRGGVLHCDLKPTNVLVTPEGRVVVLDFGLARERPRTEASTSSSIEGTPSYVAPELVAGASPTFASDWYGVGVMLFQALTGRVPFDDPHYARLLLRKLEEDAPRASSFASGIPEPLDALVTSLLARDPSERADGHAIRAYLAGEDAPSARRDLATEEPVFIGRERELEALHALFDEAARGQPRFVFVRGPSGMGKSALIRHFAAGLERGGRALVLAGRCYEREQVPFKALDSVVDALAAHLARLPGTVVGEIVPPSASALTVLFPVLGAVEAIADLPPLEITDPSEVRALAAEATRTILRRLAERAPIVIAIDDLQWGDLDSASLLAATLDPRSTTPLLFVASVRSGGKEADVVRAIRASAASTTDLDIGPLSAGESTSLAMSMLGEGADPARADDIVADAAGLPFFVTELSRFAAREGNAARGASGVDAIVAARVDALPVEARALLEVAALAGLPLPPSILARASGHPGDALPALRLLGARSLVRTATTAGLAIEPYHDRIREVVAGRLDAPRRSALHTALGDALAADATSDPETVAEHLARGGDASRALPFQIRAAERAGHALAFDRAASLYEQALAWCTEDGMRARVRESLADALVLAGRSRDAAPLYAECALHAKTDAARAAFERKAAGEWLKCGGIDEGVAVLRGVLANVGLRYPDAQLEALGRAIVPITRLRFSEARFVERAEHEVPKAKLARVDAVRTAGTGLMLVDPLRGYGFLARFLLEALDAGEPRRVSAGLSLNAVTLCRGGEAGYPKAKRWLDEARAIGARMDDDYLRGLADACEAGASVCTGRYPVAARLALAAPPLLRTKDSPATWECTAAGSLARTALFYCGDLATLRPLSERQLRAAEDVGDLFAGTYARVHGWFAAAMDGEVARGRDELHDALARWSRLGFHAMHFWALYGELQYDLYEGEAVRGLKRLEEARAKLKKSRILAMQFYRIFLGATEGNLLLARGREGDARAAERIAQTLEGEGPQYAKGFAALIRARSAMRAGNERDALAASELATRTFGACEMQLFAAAARAQHGAIVGGQGGRDERDGALAAFATLGIRAPEQWVTMLGGALSG